MNPLTRPEVTATLAEAYRTAAAAGAEMRDAVEVLETARASLLAEQDALDTWEALDGLVGRAELPALRGPLAELRRAFVERLAAAQITALRQDPAAWLRAIVPSFARWRVGLCRKLLSGSLPLPREHRTLAERLRRGVEQILDQRWAELRDLFLDLAEMQVDGTSAAAPAPRVQLLVYAAQIELLVLDRPNPALELLERASRIMPEDDVVLDAWGERWQSLGDLAAAEKTFRRAIELSPRHSRGYRRMGELEENRGNVIEAEGWFERAVVARPFDVAVFHRLIRCYARPESWQIRSDRVQRLLDTVLDVEPDDIYGTWVEMGAIHERWSRKQEARECYEKAMALDARRILAPHALGVLDRQADQYDAARRHFQQAIELAPECFDSYWLLAQTLRQQEHWAEALAAYEACLPRRPEWAGEICSAMGEMLRRAGRNAEAEELLLTALKVDVDHASLLRVLDDLATEAYQQRDDLPGALRIYQRMREIKGSTYEASFQNRNGNAWYFAGRNEEAVAAYERAITAAPDVAVYHGNLSRALRRLERWKPALAALDRADALGAKSGEDPLTDDRALLANAEGNAHYRDGHGALAAACYQHAIDLQPNDPVYYSNLSLAHEALSWRGNRRACIDQALAALNGALARMPEEASYVQRLADLGARRRACDLHVPARLSPQPGLLADPIVVEWPEECLLPELVELSESLADRCWHSYGVMLPGICHRAAATVRPPGRYLIRLGEIPVVAGQLGEPGEVFVSAAPAQLESMGLAGRSAVNPVNGRPGIWIRDKDEQVARKTRFSVWNRLEYPLRHLEAVLCRNLSDVVGHDEIELSLRARLPDSARPDAFTDFVTVCRALLAEEVSLARLEDMLPDFAARRARGECLLAIAEGQRSLPSVRGLLPANNANHFFVRLSPELESLLAACVCDAGDQPVLAMEPATCQAVLAALRQAVQGIDVPAALVVEEARIRPHTRKLVELEFPFLWVLSRSELDPAHAGKFIKTVSMAEARA